MTVDLHLPDDWGASGFVVAIPARDEAARLPTALQALAADETVRDVIVIANGCTDGTARFARTGHPGLRVAVLETGALPGGVGEARRLGMQAALDAAPQATILATTDADCRVGPNWGAITIDTLWRADAVCGRIVAEPAEFARLPPLVRRHGAMEEIEALLAAELEGLRHPLPHDPLPRHGQTPGASLAFRTSAYLAAGGFEAIRCHEDRRIVARIEAAGGRVARPRDLFITASCRLTGRAPGGMADTIAARALDRPWLRAEILRLSAEIVRLRSEIATFGLRPGSILPTDIKGSPDVLPFEQAAI